MIKRLAYYNLLAWHNSHDHKPLLLFGARQVGKTYLARQLGQLADNFIEVNLEKTPGAKQIFTGNLEPKQLIRQLSILLDQEIIPGKTLLFIDEIQEEPRAILALRYLYEEIPTLHVLAAGSLLDFAIDQVGIPVGRVSFCWIYPLSFMEFLFALGHKALAQAILQQPWTEALPEPIHNKALNLLGEYVAIGGMPEVVRSWQEHQKLTLCQNLQQDIITAYQKDFAKYAKKHQIKYVDLIFNQLPRSISQHFKYSLLDTHYKKRELEPALQLLNKARILHIIKHTHGTGVPLGAEADPKKIKVIMLDIALTQTILGLSPKDWLLEPSSKLSNKGAIAEALIGQELLAYQPANQPAELFYWQRNAKSSQAEIDYLYAYERCVIPLEVKSGHGANLQSIRQFLKDRPHTPYGIRFSTYNYSYVDKLQNLPLYAAACICPDKTALNLLLEDET